MNDYLDYGRTMAMRTRLLLTAEGCRGVPTRYEDFMNLDQWLRKLIGSHLPLVLSDNYEHFMARLPHRRFAAQHVLIRRQIGGFTVAAGYWKWLEFLTHRITREEVELVADFFSAKHLAKMPPRQFDKDYWLHVVDDYDGYVPVRVEYPGEGTVFTGVPFPVAEVYGETPAVWVNEPLYIQIGQLSHVATIAAQFAEVLGDPWRFIEVAFRALQNREWSDDFLLAMLIGGGIISTSNDFGAFVNGAPFKPSGTTGHCWYQQYETQKDALRALLGSPLGPYATVLLDLYDHERGFNDLMEVLAEGLPQPFAERPDSGDTLKRGMHDLMALEDGGHKINVVFEDGKSPADALEAERTRRQLGLSTERSFYGAGGSFLGPRSRLEAAYKACLFHDGTVAVPEGVLETMKICLDDPMKQSLPGRIAWFLNSETGMYMIGCRDEAPPAGYLNASRVLYDGLSNPGKPYVDPTYNPQSLVTSEAVMGGVDRSKLTRVALGPSFTLQIGENRTAVAMTKQLRDKRRAIYERVLATVGAK